MASFHKGKFKKPWSVRFVIVENGVEKHKRLSGFATKSEANQAYLDFMANYKTDDTKYKPLNGTNLHYNDLIKRYFDYDILQTKETTFISKKHAFDKYITPAFKNKRLELIDKEFLYNWQMNLWKKDLSYKYKTKIRGHLSHFLSWVDSVYELPNKLKQIKKPKRIEPKKEMLIWELSDIEKFAATCDDVLYKTLIMFQFFTGNRIGETFALSEADIANNKVVINKTHTRKAIGTPYKIVPTTKNYVNRITPIPDILIKQMEEYLAWKRKENIPDTFLFGGNRPLSDTTLRRYFDKYTDDAGLKRIRIHDLRHSYVSMLIHLGLSSKVIAELIGDTEEQVIKTYSHIYGADKENAINKLDQILSKK